MGSRIHYFWGGLGVPYVKLGWLAQSLGSYCSTADLEEATGIFTTSGDTKDEEKRKGDDSSPICALEDA